MSKISKLAPPDGHHSRMPWWLPLLMGLLATLPFWSGLDNDFVWDDQMNIVENSHIHQLDQEAAVWMFTETYGGHYHPLTWLTIALNYHFSGQNPTAYIATNIVMHGLVTALLFLLIHQLLSPLFHDRFEGRRLFIFAAATLFWALHPLRVEAVIWITERRNVLAGIFVLLALLAYTKFTRAQKRRWLWYGVCLMATGLSLLSKAWAITLPIILLLIDLYPLKRRLQLSLLLEKIPFFLLSLAFGLSAFTAQSTEALATFASHGIADRIGQIFYSLGFLPAKTVLPTGLSPLYLLKPEFSLTSPWVMPAIATVTLITGIALYLALIRKHNGPLVAWLSAIIVMLPVAGIAHSGSQITADRYTYLAAIPFSFLLAGALQQLSKHYGHRYIVIPTSLILLLLAAASLQQTSAWKNAYSLWSHAISQDSTNYVAYYNRGTTGRAEHDQAGRYADLTRAIELNPNYAGAYNNRGRLLLQNNKPHPAYEDFRNAVRADPSIAQPYINIGVIYLDHFNQPAEAGAAYSKALAIEPNNYAALANLGVINQRQGDRKSAIEYFTKALKSNSDNGLVWLNLGLCYLESNQLTSAGNALEKAVQLAPREPECWLTLGKLHLAQDRRSLAVASIQQALKIAPPTWANAEYAQQLLTTAKDGP